MIDSVELEIGGQRIDKQHGHWMETWAELSRKFIRCSRLPAMVWLPQVLIMAHTKF